MVISILAGESIMRRASIADVPSVARTRPRKSSPPPKIPVSSSKSVAAWDQP